MIYIYGCQSTKGTASHTAQPDMGNALALDLLAVHTRSQFVVEHSWDNLRTDEASTPIIYHVWWYKSVQTLANQSGHIPLINAFIDSQCTLWSTDNYQRILHNLKLLQKPLLNTKQQSVTVSRGHERMYQAPLHLKCQQQSDSWLLVQLISASDATNPAQQSFYNKHLLPLTLTHQLLTIGPWKMLSISNFNCLCDQQHPDKHIPVR